MLTIDIMQFHFGIKDSNRIMVNFTNFDLSELQKYRFFLD